MGSMVQRFDERCPCRRDCPGRSASCRTNCREYAEYASLKQEEYALRIETVKHNELRRAATNAQKSRLRKRQMDLKANGGLKR